MKDGGGSLDDHHEEEIRCACGQLLVKVTPEGVEVKCRRCKRIRLLRWPLSSQARTQKRRKASPLSNEPGKGDMP